MTNIDSQIEGVEKFIERLSEKDSFPNGVFWALMRNSAFSKNRTARDTLAVNGDVGELEESLSLLADEVRLASEAGESIMHVRLYTDEKLTNLVGNRKYRIKEQKTDTGIFGISGAGASGNLAGFLIQSNQQALGQIHEAKTDLVTERLNRKIEDLESELDFERNNKESFLEKLGNSVSGYVETKEGIGKILETVDTVAGLIRLFKTGNSLGNIPTGTSQTAKEHGISLTEDQAKWLKVADELEKVYDGNIFQLAAILLFHKTHFSSKFDKIIAGMAQECEKKRIELENKNED